MPADEHLTRDSAKRPLVGRTPEIMEWMMMARRQFLRAVPALVGVLGMAACEHPRALPSGPSPRAEVIVSSAMTADIAALQRTVDALAADPANAGAARQAIAQLPEAKKLAQRFDAEFWARLEATARSQPAISVLPR
ncbi:MAG TPA: hypothetical protein VGV85_07305 [Longimicrobiaceae bacterium]|nr:hypothetical protein [Longimicrobiaceae bacterium]